VILSARGSTIAVVRRSFGGMYYDNRNDREKQPMRVLVGCEFSGVVREAFRKRGHDAWSCDLLDTLIPGQHYKGDIRDIIRKDKALGAWDLFIVHPPCTNISNMSNCRINEPGRKEKREAGLAFFMEFINIPIPRIAIENPRGLPERAWRPADQIIQPYQFGHPQSKATCLWLKNLPLLVPTKIVQPERKWDGKRWRTWVDTFGSNTSKQRSITFQGIADAMAEQWGDLS
jgi:hypothetical protein